jgi:hypothetical protein
MLRCGFRSSGKNATPHHVPILLHLIAISCVLSIGVANAEPLLLTCEGQMRAVSRNVSDQYTLALTIDLVGEKVAVGSRGVSPIKGKADNTLAFGKELVPKYGGPTGSVNRITREASIR